MEFEQILQLIDHVSDSKLTSFKYDSEDLKLSMGCKEVQTVIAGNVDMTQSAAMLENAVPVRAAEPALRAQEQRGNLVKSPLVGTFYTAPSEEAESFVKVGDKVKKGQILAIVEAMKLMNDIESDFDGEVAEVLAENGKAVEYGQPLFRVI